MTGEGRHDIIVTPGEKLGLGSHRVPGLCTQALVLFGVLFAFKGQVTEGQV